MQERAYVRRDMCTHVGTCVYEYGNMGITEWFSTWGAQTNLRRMMPNNWGRRIAGARQEHQEDTFEESYMSTGILQSKGLTQNQSK
jgi:hypothetical protein